MIDHTHSTDSLPTAADVSSAIDFTALSIETASTAGIQQRNVLGFGDGGERGCPLFVINPEADLANINDFTNAAEAALNGLLSDAVQHGGMEGDRAWLVELLVQATRTTTRKAYSRN